MCLCVRERERGERASTVCFPHQAFNETPVSGPFSLATNTQTNDFFSQIVSSFYVVFLTFYVDHLKTFFSKMLPSLSMGPRVSVF